MLPGVIEGYVEILEQLLSCQVISLPVHMVLS